MKEYKCKKCDYVWTPRTNKEPKCCPKCKSYKWNECQDKAETT